MASSKEDNVEKISVKNYRSISDSGNIDICPLTVVVGKNSAGKSSFIRLFPLLKQTLERKISDPLLWYGDYVDFGDFQHTVSKQNPNNPIEIDFTERVHSRYFYRHFISNNSDKDFLADVKLCIREKFIESVKIQIWDQVICININENGYAKIVVNNDERPFEKKEILSVTQTGDIIPTLYEKNPKRKDNYYIRQRLGSDCISYCIDHIYIKSNRKNIKENISIYDGIDVKFDSKENILKQLKKKNPAKYEDVKIEHKRFQKLNNYIVATKISEIIDRINASVLEDMRQTSYLKPIRAMVNRYYRVQGISIDELDADGSNLPMILKNMSKTELSSFELWSKEKFGVVFSVTSGEGHISLVIKDDVEGIIMTNVADTGYGYSQMLPIVMLLWMIHNQKRNYNYVQNRTIVIEQPELHLHPAYQAKMIDVFINIINEAKKNKVVIKIILETHSETMINRIGTLISEKKIDNRDVNVLIFNKIMGNTEINSKSFNEDGLLMGWPIGFFSIEED